jgi:hypothetical protein
MEIDDFGHGDPEFPHKFLDKRAYVRVEPETGEPQLIRIEPMVSDGELVLDTVVVTVDNGPRIPMDREAAESYVESQNCVPLAEFAQWKHKKEN